MPARLLIMRLTSPYRLMGLSQFYGTTSETIDVTPVDDSDAEGDETIVIVLDNVTAGPAVDNATATMILVDDDMPGFPLPTDNGTEDSDNASFLISLSMTATDDVEISYTLSGTAVDDTDYNALDNTSTDLTSTIYIDRSGDNTTIFYPSLMMPLMKIMKPSF